MKKASTVFLQIVLAAFGIGILTFLLWEPWLEGVNANAASFVDIYFDDPFLAYMYLSAIPFFVGLYNGVMLLGYAGQNNVFTLRAVRAIRKIKYCAFLTAAAFIGADAFLMISARMPGNTEDAAGAVAIGIIATFLSIVVGTAAALFERTLQNAVDLKSEHDLTV